MRRLAAIALAALALVACGRIGPVKPPGPPEAVIYPRGYPQYTDLPRPQDAQAPAPTLGPSQLEQLVPGVGAR